MMESYQKEHELWSITIDSLMKSEPSKESKEYKEWLRKTEEIRRNFDRVAFCGRVPVNVKGGKPGDYLIPINGGDGKISGCFVSNPDFNQFKLSVGRVWNVDNHGLVTVSVLMI